MDNDLISASCYVLPLRHTVGPLKLFFSSFDTSWPEQTIISTVTCIKLFLFPLDFRFVSAGDDNSAIIWDVKLGRKLFTLSGHTLPITCACLLPPVYKYPDYCEGREERLLTGSSDRKICMWNASTGECMLTLSQHKSAIKVRIAWENGQIVLQINGLIFQKEFENSMFLKDLFHHPGRQGFL